MLLNHDEAVRAIIRHIPKTSSRREIVMRALTMCEHTFNTYLSQVLARPTYLMEHEFTLAETVAICRSIGKGTGRNEWVWTAVYNIEEMRRAIVQNVTQDIQDAMANSLVLWVEDNTGGIDLRTDSSLLPEYMATVITCAILYQELVVERSGDKSFVSKKMKPKPSLNTGLFPNSYHA